MPATPTTTRVERNAGGTATITNSGGSKTKTTRPIATGDAGRSRYDEMARTFASQATGNYTVQFELVCETPSLSRAVRDGGNAVWFVPIAYRNRSCYRVFWGHYNTKEEATRAAKEIPFSLRGASPVVVKIPRA